MHQKTTIIVVDEMPDTVRTDLGNVDMSTVATDGNVVWTCEALATTDVDTGQCFISYFGIVN